MAKTNDGRKGVEIFEGMRVVYIARPDNSCEDGNRYYKGYIEDGDAGEIVSLDGLRNPKFGKDDGNYVTVKFDSTGQEQRIYVTFLTPEIPGQTTTVVERYETKLAKLVEQQDGEMEKLTKRHEAERQEILTRLEYLKESGAKAFNSEEFRVYTALKAVENPNLTLMERTKIIANLLEK